MKFSEKEIRIFKSISLAAGIFTLFVAITMIFSLVQLKTLDPINSPSIQSVKDQFDKDPENRDKAEQVRAIDLMARKAYFSSRWQVETGSYLLLAGAFIFVLFQRLVAGSEKPARSLRPDRPDINSEREKNRRYLIISAVAIAIIALVSSFALRKELPAPGKTSQAPEAKEVSGTPVIANLPGDVNFPFFRGEGSLGIAGGTGFPTEWNGTDGKNIKWKIPNPKPGKSSPVIWGDRLFITGAEGADFELYCIDKNNGKILWSGSGTGFPGASAEIPESDTEAGMAVPTAAVNKDVICAVFGNGNLVCYDHNGKLKWGKNVGVPHGTYAYSASLLIYGKLLLVQYDSQNKLSLLGFDLATGEQKWETQRQGRPVNSSPVLATYDGQPQLLINGNPNVSSYDPVTGQELWSLPGVSGDVAPSLAANSKLVYAVTDYYSIIALKPGKTGATVWQDNTYTSDVSSPAATENFFFITTGNGDAACYNAEKGDTLWTHYFGNPFYASVMVADNKVWMLDRTGIMHIVEAAGKLKIAGNSSLGENTDCTPVFSEGRIYIRGRQNLYCIAEK
ncbi:MAG: PQQ-binding-like beta-propeller repeat protein [Bacteroidota bacterium]|nr:PQQ-binding-like beta-propeller repeat protein [Bacteroidota bacterium]